MSTISPGRSARTDSKTAPQAAPSASSKASGWLVGCFTRPWAQHDYRVAFDGIAAAGFKYAGLMTASSKTIVTPELTPDQAATIGAEAKTRGLQIASVFGGGIEVKESIAQGITGMRRLIDNTAACGSRSLLLAGHWDPAMQDNYYKAVAECCDYAAEKGVGISVKPHGPLNSTGKDCRALIQKVGHKNFGLCYDPGNIYYYSDGKLDPAVDAAEVDGLVVGMCVKDFRMPKAVDLTPGTGMVNFPRVMARLRKGGFTSGPLVVECLNPGDLATVNAEAKKACLFLEALVK